MRRILAIVHTTTSPMNIIVGLVKGDTSTFMPMNAIDTPRIVSRAAA